VTPEHEAWRKNMSRSPLPKTEGCFKGTYPSAEWQEVPCLTPPNVPMVPAPLRTTRGGAPTVGNGEAEDVGNGNGDVIATAGSGGTFVFSEGSFPVTSGISGSQNVNYTLQLNTNLFTTSYPVLLGPNVKGWQQFIYSPGDGVYIQYWLVNWGGADCPIGGWNKFTGNGIVGCWRNSAGMTGAPGVPISGLGSLVLAATASPDSDAAVLYTGDGNVYARGQASTLGLASGWNQSEFNVFGPGNNSQVSLPPGSTLAVQTLTAGGASSTGAWTNRSYTGETNNLTVVPGSACIISGAAPGVRFTESNAPGATALPCPPAATPVVGGAVAAAQQVGLDETDLFTIDQNGAITVSWTMRNEPWNVPWELTGPWYPAGAPLVATPEYGLTQTDVIAVNKSGDLAVSWVVGDGTWQGPGSISSGGNFNPGTTHIAASQLYGSIDPETHVFAVNKYGALTDTYIVGVGSWVSHEISARGLFPAGAPVAVSNQGLNNVTAVFVVDNWHRMNVEWQVVQGNVEGSWQGPGPISSAANFWPGASVAVSQQFGRNQTDLFAVDQWGNVEAFWWAPGDANWQGPTSITSGGLFDRLANLSVAQQGGNPETDVFAVGKDGQLRVTWIWEGGNWRTDTIGNAGAYPSGASVAAGPQFGSLTSQTDVFAIDNRGLRSVSFVVGTGGWTGDVGIE
jgi:hypothetical protein